MLSNRYGQVTISAASKAEAEKISDLLVKKKLMPGTLIVHGPSRYWWKGKIVEKKYYNVKGFTLQKHEAAIIREVKKIHSDEYPIIAFVPIDGNREFLVWITTYPAACRGVVDSKIGSTLKTRVDYKQKSENEEALFQKEYTTIRHLENSLNV